MTKISQSIYLLLATSITMACAEIDRSFSWTDEVIDQYYGNASPERGARSQHEALAGLRNDVREAAQRPLEEVIPMLTDGLRKLTRKNVFQLAERIEVYDLVQSTLLANPGHAKYFQQELERLRLDQDYAYERIRAQYLAETLQHLPSPETVQVLGNYLSDMRDTPYDENPKYDEMVKSGELKPFDWTPMPQNAWLATYALSNIGLRNPPFEPVKDYGSVRFSQSKESLPKFRKWWDEVKSGQRTFSFNGQDVEYRFKPDGTWETIALESQPGDIPETNESEVKERPSEKRPPVKSPPGDQMQKEETQGRNPWLWICGLGVVLLGLIALIGRRFKKH